MRVAVLIAGLAVVAGAAVYPGVEPASAPAEGRITGRIEVSGSARFQGSAPAGETVDMSSDQYCANAHAGQTVMTQTVTVGSGGGLKDVIVHVRNAPSGGAAAPSDPVVLDQNGCMYAPHVVVLRVGQPLVIRNSDNTLHNVHIRPQVNREVNIGQPMQGMESRREFESPEVGIAVTCDIHRWMGGAMAVFDHPYFDVTGDDGGFTLDGLPPGQYEVEAWHETLGVQTQAVTVDASGNAANVTFTFGG